ncbi:unnamed protein product [Durusdinium trenchii]|uniref:Uncharacterized protein n=1 Tax=Durusdinium trenchii TaxID=1381693 RepID=A0ABP0SS99_9DINO
MPCTLQAFSQDDFCWNLSFPGVGRGRSTVHGVHPFFSSFAEHQHDSVTREIVGSGKGLSKKEAIVQGKEPDTGASATAGPTHSGTDTSTTAAASGQNKSKEAKAEAKGADAKGPAEASAASGGSGATELALSEHRAGPDAETAGSGKGKAGKGKGTFDDWMKGKGKGKGGKSGYHRHGRSPHRSHSPRGRHPSLRRRKSGASKRLKHLLQRQRQMRSHSPRSVGTLHWSPSPWRYGDRLRMGSYPSKSVGSLRRSVGLLQTGTERHLSSIEHAVPSALLPWGPRRRTAEFTAFLFGIGKSADEAHRIDQETEQQEIQEEAKSVVNAESAGYDQPTGVEQGEEEEFEHEHDLEAMSPEEMYNQPRGPGCECPAWDPLKTALPEDKQHASLVMLQRRIRPENRVAPSLREAASAVEHAGRLFEGWVRRRQQLADVLPELAVKMEYCHNRAKDFAHSAAEGALKSLQQRLEEEKEAEAATEEQAEMTEGQRRFQAIGEAQEDVNELAQQETAQQNTAQQDLAAQGLAAQSMAQQGLVQQEMHGGHYGQSAFLGQVPTGRNTRAAFQDVGQLAQAMGQIYGRPQPPPPQMPPGHDASAAAPEAATPQEAALEAPKQVEVEEEMKEEEDLEQAREAEDWGDFFRECGEFRIPPTVLAARRAANEAYWAFDRAMQVAEKKVGRAIQHSVLRGA